MRSEPVRMRSGLARDGAVLTAIAARDPHLAGEHYAELLRRHERLKSAAMDLIGMWDKPVGDFAAGKRAISRLRRAVYAEIGDGR